ncbi:hypothetical protein HPB47_024747 [Ixodes persulcatus]|uniref:Uncharacterized protein n=1 Tax=Ixodes persulcatus TaxID=34615 RepID=A0AC60Q653_IXOPE|nr:hypothetical protein HPB47_024747 [Ixodes persulcatus]
MERTEFAASFKKKPILVSEDVDDSSAAQRLGVDKSTIWGWRKSRARIFQAAPTRRAFYGLKRGRYPDLEKELAMFRAGSANLLDVPPNYAVGVRGTKEVRLHTTGNEKARRYPLCEPSSRLAAEKLGALAARRLFFFTLEGEETRGGEVRVRARCEEKRTHAQCTQLVERESGESNAQLSSADYNADAAGHRPEQEMLRI